LILLRQLSVLTILLPSLVSCSIFGGILQGIILPQVVKIPVRDRKVVAVGMTKLLTQSTTMLSPPLSTSWPKTLDSLLALILLPVDLTAQTAIAEDDISGLVDPEDGSAAGFQASFARLGASEAKKEDPVSWLPGGDEKAYLRSQLAGVQAQVGGLMGQVNPEALSRLQQS
jgi:exportin-2 (importin alpha re-exporter)